MAWGNNQYIKMTTKGVGWLNKNKERKKMDSTQIKTEEKRNPNHYAPEIFMWIEYGGVCQDYKFSFWQEDHRGGRHAHYQGVSKGFEYSLCERTLNELFNAQVDNNVVSRHGLVSRL